MTPFRWPPVAADPGRHPRASVDIAESLGATVYMLGDFVEAMPELIHDHYFEDHVIGTETPAADFSPATVEGHLYWIRG